MAHFPEMDWNWENPVGFGSKAVETPRKMQLMDWMTVDDGEIEGGSFIHFAGSGNVGASASDDGTQTQTVEGVSGSFNGKMQIKGTETSKTSPHLETLIGLKLGKRTYFENSSTGGNAKSASIPSTASFKKTKSSSQSIHVQRCVVEGCNVDLSMAKEYHRKHRVCGSHSKCPKVIVGGLECRFCQQCSRFHNLSEFDETKRSCRKRLSDHNARRRKPQQDPIQFNSTRRSSPFYGERQQLSFLLNDSPPIHSRDYVDTTWDSTCNSKFTLTKGYPMKFIGEGGSSEPMHIPGIKLPHAIDIHGSKGSLISSHSDATPEYRRALSLLSNNNWAPCGSETMPAIHENGTCVTQPMMHTIQEDGSLCSPELWQAGHQLAIPRLQSLVSNSDFQETQLLVSPYEAELYSQVLN